MRWCQLCAKARSSAGHENDGMKLVPPLDKVPSWCRQKLAGPAYEDALERKSAHMKKQNEETSRMRAHFNLTQSQWQALALEERKAKRVVFRAL